MQRRRLSLAFLLLPALGASPGAESSPSTPVSTRAEVLPFIADDYPRALLAARAGKRPIFLEAWAPW